MHLIMDWEPVFTSPVMHICTSSYQEYGVVNFLHGVIYIDLSVLLSVARVRVWASHGYRYGRSTAIRSYVRAYCRCSYGRMTDMALRGVAYIVAIYTFSVEFCTKARMCKRPFPRQFFSSTVVCCKRGFL